MIIWSFRSFYQRSLLEECRTVARTEYVSHRTDYTDIAATVIWITWVT
jgi:hypothetical protein